MDRAVYEKDQQGQVRCRKWIDEIAMHALNVVRGQVT